MSFTVFPIGPFEISIGGIITFFGVILASLVLIRTIRDEEVSLRFLSDHLFFFVIIPLFLGRLGAFISLWPSLSRQFSGNILDTFSQIFTSFLLIGEGGIRTDWVLAGFFVVFFIIAFWRKEKFFAWLDAFILPAIVIALFVSLGGYFAGWAYGKPAPDWLFFPFTIQYDLMEVRYSGEIYAVQLYTAFILAFIFYIGWTLWKHKAWQRWRAGKFFMVMLTILGFTAGFLDFFRGDPVSEIHGVRVTQIVAFSVAFLALFFLFFRQRDRLVDRIREGRKEK